MAPRCMRLAAIGACVWLAAAGCSEPTAPPESAESARVLPNVIYILLDDAGYGDFAAGEDAAIPTPHLDRLAASGIVFTTAYAAAPVC